MSIFLICDTAHGTTKVIIANNNKILAFKDDKRLFSQAEILVNIIQDLLNENNLTLNDIDYFGINNGPGSYTGVRINIATIQGMNFIYNKDIIFYSTFDAIFNNFKNNFKVNDNDIIVTLIPSRKDYYDYQIYDYNGNILISNGNDNIDNIVQKYDNNKFQNIVHLCFNHTLFTKDIELDINQLKFKIYQIRYSVDDIYISFINNCTIY